MCKDWYHTDEILISEHDLCVSDLIADTSVAG